MERRHKRSGAAVPGALWLSGLALLLLAGLGRDPYLFSLRAWPPVATIALGLVGLLTVVLTGRRGGSGAVLAGVWLAVPMVPVIDAALFAATQRVVLAADSPRARAVGQRFVIGYQRVEQVAPLAARGLIGGIFVTRRNVEGRTAEALRVEIAALQSLRSAAGLPPLIVATDQEGGMVSRLSPPLQQRPPLSTLARLPAGARRAAAHTYGTAQGRELAALGVTVNFAPVLDLRLDRPRNRLDLHSQIRQRATAADPDIVAEVALGYVQGLQGAGVTATLKHFPGLGRVDEDTHHFAAELDASTAELAAQDWLPFRRVAALPDILIMLGHVTVTAIDADHPASLSRRLVQDLLRRDWGFRGRLITDDLTMGAVYRRGLCRATVEAFAAGVDLLLVSYDWEQYYRAMACALRQIAEAGEPDYLAAPG